MKQSHKVQDMTQGSCLGHLIRFTLPLLCGSCLQQLYNLVDSWVVGRYVSDTALAAVGMGFPVIMMYASLFGGIATGTTVMIAQYYGAGRTDRVKDVVETSYGCFVRGILPMTLLCAALTWPMLWLMNVKGEMYAPTLTYLLILGSGVVGTLGYNLNAGILQGLGNSRTTLLFLAISSVLNILLDLLFVIVFCWGVTGAAVATVLSQLTSFLVGLWYIRRTYPELWKNPFRCRIEGSLFKKIIGIGLPHGLQQSVVSLAVMLVYAQVNAYGEYFSAGYNLGAKMEDIIYLAILALSSAATTFTGQNMGAEKLDRVRQGTRVTLLLALGWTALVNLVIVPCRYGVIGFFSQQPETIEAGALYVQCVLPFLFLFSAMYCLSSIMRGAGESVVPLIVSLTGLAVRLVAVWILSSQYGKEFLYYGFAFGYAVSLIIAAGYYATGRWMRKGSLAKDK